MSPLKFLSGYELDSYPCDVVPGLAYAYATRLQEYGYTLRGAGKLRGEATVQAIISVMDGSTRAPSDYTATVIGPFILKGEVVGGSAIGIWHRP